MIQFSKLRIQGFKSFVEKTELEISPGLNGIVGPNGCGKSNLVEALRWIMGENSAKRMRGDGMEDVIFAGTDKRPARNLAEVSLLLDNTARTAPALWNGSDEIEISRKIEKDKGSNYRINGKSVRARDVQMLFADTVTGANSPALVSQGRVAQIISAKPLDRRIILEESAGISGLYARRHEAELRLKAADRNLERVQDVLGSMEGRLASLKKQARQAGRYRNISAQIRQMEVMIAHLEWTNLLERKRAITENFNAAESIVADKLAVVTQLSKTQNTQMQDLPALRNKESEAAAALQVQKIALQRMEDEQARREKDLQDTIAQIDRATLDKAHESQTADDATGNLDKLEGEQKFLIEAQEKASHHLEEKQKARDELESKVLHLEERHDTLVRSEAEAKARKDSLMQQVEQNAARIETLKERLSLAEKSLKDLKQSDDGAVKLQALETGILDLEAQRTATDKIIEETEVKQSQAKNDVQTAREDVKKSERVQQELSTEINMLESFLNVESGEGFTVVRDTVKPQAGFEKAVSRALGDALLASLDDAAPSRWIKRGTKPANMQALPAGAESILPYVDAPEALHLALTQIGYVPDNETGHKLMGDLSSGQALVSAEGTYWRWDGYFVEAKATDRNAKHLEQKNKLSDLLSRQPAIEKAVSGSIAALEKAMETQISLENLYKETLGVRRRIEGDLSNQKTALANLKESRARLESENIRLKETIANTTEDIKTLTDVIKWDKDRLSAHEEQTKSQKAENAEDIRQVLTEARAAYQEAMRAFDRSQQEQNTRKARLHAIADERIALQNRSIRARERLKELEKRLLALQEQKAQLDIKPKDISVQKDMLLAKISELEATRQKASDALSQCENEVAETVRALKDAETILSDARESRALAQATLSNIAEQITAQEENIQSKFEMSPHELERHIVATDMPQEANGLEGLKSNRDQLTRDRDMMGPVNLQAEDEAVTLEKDVTKMLNERNDLIEAIAELRGGIKEINNEARERLQVAFAHVNAHFTRLFTKLFGGGRAYLQLTESDDPLEAGLEIYASPPGKTLQSLSLLSGGEQALTAIALIFGMFLTNPSPICVLDEIDAPLDDANVDRVCNVLEEMSQYGETRFLIITHHRLTMARMDRLYGVTMMEKGVSKLVSVDLQQSFEFLDAA